MAAVTVTPAARERMIRYIEANAGTPLHFGINGKGCGGFSYVLQIYNAQRDGEIAERIVLNNNDENSSPELVIDHLSLLYILGTIIDWQESAMGGAYVFSNPLAQSTCGCGTSFSV